MAEVFFVAYAAFTVWMVLDALRRRVSALWYVVLMVPSGPVVYFFAVKLRDYNVRAPEPELVPKRSPIEEVAHEVQQSPSFQNRVRMGWALLEQGQPGPAQRYFEQALNTHKRDKEALYGLGVSQLEHGASEDAVRTLSSLVERCFAYEDYEAALALVEALMRTGKDADASVLLEQVVEDSGRLEHQLALARQHIRLARRVQAQAVLRCALEQFEAQPDFLRQRNGAAATEARQLLRTLEQATRQTRS